MSLTEYTLAGGCFWCLDAVYRQVLGVQNVVTGFTGGQTRNPTYRQVCTGKTGHAEAVQVSFNWEIVPQDIILDIFFTMHNPSQLNRQGADIGTQYRSAMFAKDATQRKLFAQALERAGSIWQDKIVTTINDLDIFWQASDSHQNFYSNNQNNGYCAAVINPKIAKFRSSFSKYLLKR